MFARKLIEGILKILVLLGGFLFLPAWTLHWWRAWVLIVVVVAAWTATMLLVLIKRQDLLNERSKPLIQPGQPRADRILVVLGLTSSYALVVLVPLDVFYLHALRRPGFIISSLGMAVFLAGWLLVALAFRENAFAAPVIKSQADRRQVVVDTGVYSVVRHPLYSGTILMLMGMPLWLESYVAALFAALPVAILVARISVEENFLRRELAGYSAYCERVRRRLIPNVW
jgi:protein-S-isoprenylcysteine O-methyltransferase Ste14